MPRSYQARPAGPPGPGSGKRHDSHEGKHTTSQPPGTEPSLTLTATLASTAINAVPLKLRSVSLADGSDGADDVRQRLRRALREALRSRDVPAASALRSGLAAIDNAEAVPVSRNRTTAT